VTAALSDATAETPQRVTDDNGQRHYTYPVTGERFVSVTTVTNGTEDASHYLAPWRAKLAARYAVEHAGQLIGVAHEHGQDVAISQITRAATLLSEIKADAGSHVHDVVEALIKWAASPAGRGSDIVLPALPEHLVGALYDEEPIEDVIDYMLTGFLNFMADWSPRIIAAEMPIYNRAFKMAGTLDSIMELLGLALRPDGRTVAAPGSALLAMVDCKTGRHMKASWREQITAYRHMTEAWVPPGELVPLPGTNAGAVLHLRPEYRRGYRLMFVAPSLDEEAWNTFRHALNTWRGRDGKPKKTGPVAYPLRADGTLQPPYLADLDGEGYGRAPKALIKTGLFTVEDVAAFTADQLLELDGIGPKTIPLIEQILTDHWPLFRIHEEVA
jgi:hypothetical protein